MIRTGWNVSNTPDTGVSLSAIQQEQEAWEGHRKAESERSRLERAQAEEERRRRNEWQTLPTAESVSLAQIQRQQSQWEDRPSAQAAQQRPGPVRGYASNASSSPSGQVVSLREIQKQQQQAAAQQYKVSTQVQASNSYRPAQLAWGGVRPMANAVNLRDVLQQEQATNRDKGYNSVTATTFNGDSGKDVAVPSQPVAADDEELFWGSSTATSAPPSAPVSAISE